ncbi:Zn(II)2Cys6 transcription factor [Lachancea thermotolerans CBS 6340]|uniref:KLTH0D00594p n=1 Tax=Lachancea thermotolerans (strain ATCC 56472 / CBS 6340 / NRRL Y-8284) TaxID=559295 RepID=C5DFW9_LACTC|nr:KLTH0D00594p [Lachancea thermotolerans CBS 6340]CAR22311.1 KLTH0D00594p [Lachancea thermotolerans CBS 6340]
MDFQPKRKRSVHGCLTCRTRRKKCDENKPVCGGCERNFVQCTWPQHTGGRVRRKRGEAAELTSDRSSTSADPAAGQGFEFHIICGPRTPVFNRSGTLAFEAYSKSSSNQLTKFDEDAGRFVATPQFAAETPEELTRWISCCGERQTTKQADAANNTQGTLDDGSVETTLDMHMGGIAANVIGVPTGAIIVHASASADRLGWALQRDNWAYGQLLERYRKAEEVTDEDLAGIDLREFLFYTCVKGFVPKLDTQYTHPSLTTGATFLPQADRNSIVRSVFACCGATYLAWYDLERFQQLSDELYIDCKTQILEYVQSVDNYADEDWLFASLLLLCIRDKNSFTGTVDGCVWHLANSFLIISEKYYHRAPAQSLDDPLSDNLLRESIVLQPQERMFLESFIYHYSISLLFARDISALPNPCALFRSLSLVLKCPVYDIKGNNDWVSNPLLGLTLDAFEILAKLSYIARMPMPLGPTWLGKVVHLKSLCTCYAPPAPTSPDMTEAEWLNYRVTSATGVLVTKACDLLAKKIIDYDSFDIDSSDVQMRTREIIQLFKDLPSDHKIWGILPWTLLITGAFCRRIEDQIFITRKIEIMAHRAHSYCGLKMSSFLHAIWNSEVGINYLFDRDRLAQVDL